MMSSKKQITVIGATGNLGVPVVKNLLSFGYEVKIIVRNLNKARQLFKHNADVEIVQGDLTDTTSLKIALKGTSCLYLSLSTNTTDLNIPFATEREGIANIIDSIDKESIKQILIISGLGAFDNSQSSNRFKFIPNIIRKQGHKIIKDSGIPYTILHCSWFIDCFVLYQRKGTYTVIGNNKSPIFFTNCYDYTLHLINAIDNQEALFREFPVQGKHGFIHSEAASRFLSAYSQKPKVNVLPAPVLRIMSVFNREMKFVKHMADYSVQSPEHFLAEDFDTYSTLGQPALDLEGYAMRLKKDDFYSYTKN